VVAASPTTAAPPITGKGWQHWTSVALPWRRLLLLLLLPQCRLAPWTSTATAAVVLLRQV
jgi:hypothetical protein